MRRVLLVALLVGCASGSESGALPDPDGSADDVMAAVTGGNAMPDALGVGGSVAMGGSVATGGSQQGMGGAGGSIPDAGAPDTVDRLAPYPVPLSECPEGWTAYRIPRSGCILITGQQFYMARPGNCGGPNGHTCFVEKYDGSMRQSFPKRYDSDGNFILYVRGLDVAVERGIVDNDACSLRCP